MAKLSVYDQHTKCIAVQLYILLLQDLQCDEYTDETRISLAYTFMSSLKKSATVESILGAGGKLDFPTDCFSVPLNSKH